MNFPMPTLSRLGAALLLCGLTAHASAAGTVVLDTYGPDINALDGWPTPLALGSSVAVPFDLSGATSIQSILSSIEGFGGVTVGILARNGAVPTGLSWLHSAHWVDPVANTVFTPSGWNLAPGSYWLAAVADTGFEGQWQSATNDPSGSWAASTGGVWSAVNTTFTGMPGARITVMAAVPEPSTYGLMLAGGLLLAAIARRKSSISRQG